jgi:hypothetical protein
MGYSGVFDKIRKNIFDQVHCTNARWWAINRLQGTTYVLTRILIDQATISGT